MLWQDRYHFEFEQSLILPTKTVHQLANHSLFQTVVPRDASASHRNINLICS